MDKFSNLCIKTNYIIDQIKPVSEFDVIFEAESSEQARATDSKNNSLMARAGENIKKIVHAILETIRKIKNKIRDFFVKLRMGKAEKEAYESYRQKVSQSPSLKNTKVTAYDFKHKTAQYNKIMARLDAEEKDAKAEEVTQQLKSAIEDFCKDSGIGIITTIGVEQALNMASGNKKIAKTIYDKLEYDEDFYSKVEQGIGSQNAEKFKNDMGKLTKTAFFKRLKLRVTGHYSRTVEGATLKTIKSCIDLVGGAKDIKDKKYVSGGSKILSNSRMLKNAAGNESIGTAVQVGKTAGKTVFDDKMKKAKSKFKKKIGTSNLDAKYNAKELSKVSKSLHDAGITKKEIDPKKAQRIAKAEKKYKNKAKKVLSIFH